MKRELRAGRLSEVPPYLFARIDALVAARRAGGVDVISLGIGDPDLPTPAPIVERLAQAAADPANHRYPDYEGSPAFREACAGWLARRFGVRADPRDRVLALIGSKEGIAHLPLALADPGSAVLVPDPGYPVYATWARLAGAEAVLCPLLEQNGFLPDLDSLSPSLLERTSILWLNYPNNPTGASAPDGFFERVVELALRHRFVVAHDAAYSEVYGGARPPRSILSVPGADDCAIEFHSFSKTFSMTGWRVGFAAGAPQVVAALGTVKNNTDSGVFGAVQQAAIFACDHYEMLAPPLREVYARRRAVAAGRLARAGVHLFPSDDTFYLWCRVPGGGESLGFSLRCLESAGVVVTPGIGFGRHGEGWFRISLTVPENRLTEAFDRLEAAGVLQPSG